MRVRRLLVLSILASAMLLPPSLEAADPAKDLKSKDLSVRLAAVETLRAEGGDQAEALLIGALEDNDWEVLEKASVALATRGTAAAVKELASVAMKGPVRRIRRAAARSVAAIDAELGAKYWTKDLTGNAALRAVESLATAGQAVGEKSGPTLRKALEKAVKSKEAPLRAAAAAGLAALPSVDRVERISRLLADPDAVVAAAALSEASRAPDLVYLEPLAAQLRRPELDDVLERRVSKAIVAALALLPDEPARTARFSDVVGPIARAKDALVSGRAARLAGVLASPPPSPPADAAPAAGAGADAKPPADVPAAPAASAPKAPSVSPEAALAVMRAALDHQGPTARALATQALGRIGVATAIDIAAGLASDDESPRVRRAAIRVVAAARGVADDATRAILTGRLAGDADASVREEAAVLLGVSGPGGVPFLEPAAALEKALEDADWAVAVSAAVSLGKTRNPAAAPMLERMLDPKRVKDWRRRGGAVVGLGTLRTKAAVAPLIASLDDKDPSVKRTAFEYLRRLTTRSIVAERELWEAWWARTAATHEFLDPEKIAREAKQGGYAATPVAVYDKLDVVVLTSRGDHIEQLLEKLGITYRLTRPTAIPVAQLHPFAVFFSNCTGEVQPQDVERLAWFVRVGGYLFGSCWALKHTIEPVLPGVVRKLPTKAEVMDHVPAMPCIDSPFFDGVFPEWSQPMFVLYGSHLIEVLQPERVEVLIDGPLATAHWGGGNLACWFSAGHGVILDSTNHFDHQGLEHVIGLKTADDRKAYSMDHLCMDYEEMRQLEGQGVFESQSTAAKEVRDASIFRFITNFVRQKRKAGV